MKGVNTGSSGKYIMCEIRLKITCSKKITIENQYRTMECVPTLEILQHFVLLLTLILQFFSSCFFCGGYSNIFFRSTGYWILAVQTVSI